MLQVRVVQGRRVAVMRFATVAFAQSDLTIWYVAIVLPILILATIVTIWGNQITGKAGEHWASEELRKLPQSEYRLLNDLVLKDSTGLHQIDHVVVSVYGIYVVETKNYTGTIYGDSKYSEWFMYLGKNKRKIHSPLRQNYGHIQCLKELLGLEDSVFISIVCFANRTKFKVKTHSDREFVVHTNDLRSTVLDHPQCMGPDMNAVADRLESLNIIDKAVRHEHIRDLQNTYSGKL
ncbi:nuclease-related domain-containing protein [Bifidobacterium adolescentis]|uniref:nuclease-related domain-containing protein n=1 Tax=Bifidobacterium adolescentis TaxID=1680 RepID=UPI004062E67F